MRLTTMKVRGLLAALSFTVVAAASAVAVGQPAASEDDKKAARELANKGYELYEAKEYAQAIKLFGQAEKRFPAPTILLLEANAHEQLGGYVEAEALYQRIIDMALGEDAPKEFVDAQASARAALPDASKRIAFVKILLKGMTVDRVRVTIDDVEIPAAKLVSPVPQNPGPHKIMATLGGDETGRSVFQSVTLKEGTTKQIQLVFRPGGPTSEAPSGGACASCEIGNLRSDARAPEALLAAAALALILGARRRSPRADRA